MAGTVISNLTDISMCESTTGWTNLGAGTQGQNDPSVFEAIQGSYCLQDYKAAARDAGAQWDFGAGTEADMSNIILIFWFAFSKRNFSANPMRIRLTDSSGNWSEWNMFTASALPHTAWLPWVLKPTVTRDDGSGTLVLSSIRYCSWRVTSASAKVFIYWDAVRYGYGLDIKGGTSGEPAELDDFITAEATYAYGIVEKYNDIYFLQGQIRIGSLTVDESTYFKDMNKVIQFKSMKGNPTGFYEIKGQNATSGSGTTKIFFGEKPDSAGISGLFISAPSTMKWKLTMSDTYITEFGFYGCTFVNADTIAGQAYSTVKQFLSTNFVACAEILPNTGIVKYCKFISSPSSAIRISSASHSIIKCDFISCNRGFHASTTAELSFDGLCFFNNTYDGYASAGAITVNYNPACSPAPSSYDPAGYVITYQTSVDLIIRKVKTGNEPTEYVRCAIYKKSDMTEIMNKNADVADDQNPTYYKATQSYSVTGIVVIVRAREKGYLPFEIELTIPSGGLDVTAVWIVDPNYEP